MIYSQAIAPRDQFLSNEQVLETLQTGFEDMLHNQRVLILIPDHTRSLPLPLLFRALKVRVFFL